MNRNLVGSILGRSSIKMLIQFQSINKHGHHRPFLFLIGRLLNIFFSVTAQPNDQHLVGSTYGRFCIKFPQSPLSLQFFSPCFVNHTLNYASVSFDLKKKTNYFEIRLKKKCPQMSYTCTMKLLTFHSVLRKLYTEPSASGFY